MNYAAFTSAVELKATKQALVPDLSLVSDLCIDWETDAAKTMYILGHMPGMKDMDKSELRLEDFNEYPFTVTNKHFGIGVPIDKRDLSRGMKSAELRAAINSLSTAPDRHIRSRLITMLENGATTTYGACFDGLALFSASHLYRGAAYATVQTNLVAATGTGTPASPTYDEFTAALETAIQQLLATKSDQGEIYHDSAEKDLILIVPKGMRAIARQALLVPTLSSGGDNPYFQQAVPEVEPRLTGTTVMYLLKKNEIGACGAFVKTWEMVDGKRFNSMITDPKDSYVQLKGKQIFSIDGYYNLNPFLWQYAQKITFS